MPSAARMPGVPQATERRRHRTVVAQRAAIRRSVLVVKQHLSSEPAGDWAQARVAR